MATPKVLTLVRSCGSCPHHVYYSGGAFECALTGEIVQRKDTIAPFCPLADYPSRAIAEMETTIRAQQDSYQYGLAVTLISHVASKLGRRLHARGDSLDIPLEDGTAVSLHAACIESVAPWESVVTFKHRDDTYQLHPDSTPPRLYRALPKEEGEEQLYEMLDIAT